MEQVVKLLAPALVAIVLWLKQLEFYPPPPDAKKAKAWKGIGLIFPALWLTSIGPSGLIQNGGFVMRLLNIPSSHEVVSLFGLIWLMLFLVCASVLHSKKLHNDFWVYPLYGVGYAALMGAIGVYAFLAVGNNV